MRKKSSATRNLAVMPRPIQRWTGVASGDAAEIDAGLYLFALCRHLQMTSLDRRGIDCRVDARDTGRFPASVCRMLGLVVSELVKDASAGSPKMITVTLRRRGTTCLCTVACQGLNESCAAATAGLQRVRDLAAELPGDCAVRPMPDRGLVAVMFDAGLVERDFPTAFWRYRANEAWRSPRQLYPTMLE
ncbi:MAG TPA: hypothetical protein VGB82_03705 [Alphaproteobacteria bacterium]